MFYNLRMPMRFMKPKKMYYDPYGKQEVFPAGLFEVYVAKEGYEDLVEKSIVSRRMAQETFWEKRHTLLRFYLGPLGVVISFRKEAGPARFSRMKGVVSASLGRMVLNLFDARPSRERK